jgi:hypothetical protein
MDLIDIIIYSYRGMKNMLYHLVWEKGTKKNFILVCYTTRVTAVLNRV